MTTDEIQRRRRTFSDHTQAAFKKVMGARYYAIDSPTLLALSALASEWQAERAL